MSIQKILIILLCTSFSSQIFSAEVKKDQQEEKKQSEEISEKESAKRFYEKFLIESWNEYPSSSSILLKALYYLIKMHNARVIHDSIIFGKRSDDFQHLVTMLQIAVNFDKLSEKYSKTAWLDINAFAGRTTLEEKRAKESLIIKKLSQEDQIFIKELYSLAYQDVKSQIPKFLKINYGDDEGKEFPKPEELNLPFHFWSKVDPETVKPKPEESQRPSTVQATSSKMPVKSPDELSDQELRERIARRQQQFDEQERRREKDMQTQREKAEHAKYESVGRAPR